MALRVTRHQPRHAGHGTRRSAVVAAIPVARDGGLIDTVIAFVNGEMTPAQRFADLRDRPCLPGIEVESNPGDGFEIGAEVIHGSQEDTRVNTPRDAEPRVPPFQGQGETFEVPVAFLEEILDAGRGQEPARPVSPGAVQLEVVEVVRNEEKHAVEHREVPRQVHHRHFGPSLQSHQIGQRRSRPVL